MEKRGPLGSLCWVFILALLGSALPAPVSAFENVNFLFEAGGPKEGSGSGSFNAPADLAVAGDGTIYVTDAGNFRVQYFDAQGKYLGQWGGKGKDPGSLGYPFGVAVGPQGSLYVSDRQENLVKVYDPKKGFVFAFGGPALLSGPCGIAMDSQGRLLVADSGNHRIAVFTLEGIFLQALGSPGSGKGQLKEPAYVAVDPSGNVYVSEAGNKRVQVFNAKGESVSVRGGAAEPSSPLQNPSGLAVTSKGMLAVADKVSGQIALLDPKGSFQTPMGSLGAGRGQFKNAGGIRLLEDGRLYVVDTGNHRLQGFQTVLPSGLPELPPGPMALRLEILRVIPAALTDLAVAPDGTLYLLDGEAGKVQVKNPDGSDKLSFGPAAGQPGHLNKATGIGVGPEDRVYIYDGAGDAFQVFDGQGNFQFAFGRTGKKEGELAGVKGFCLSQGKLYVADTGNHRVQVFSADGILLLKFGGFGSGNGQLKDPSDVAVDAAGLIYVADSGNDRVQQFDAQGRFQSKLGQPGLGNALRSLAVNADGMLFTLEVGGQENNRVQVFDARRNLRLSFGSEGEGPGQFRRASRLRVRSQAYTEVYVNDPGNRRVLQFAVKELPDRPADLMLVNQETATVISWKRRPESFVQGYRIYYLPEGSNLPRRLGETAESSLTVTYPLDPPGYQFRVTAFSGLGLESPPSPTLTDYFPSGLGAFQAGDYAAAEEKFLRQFNENPASALSLKYLGLSRLARGKNPEALRAFSELTKAPEFAGEARLQMGRIYTQLKRYPEAEAELKRAVECAPENARIYQARGELFLAEGLFREAQQELEKARARDPENPQPLELLSRCFCEQKLFQKAQESLEQALKLAPKDSGLYRSLARLQRERKDIPGAIATLEKALEINPHDATAMVLLGEIYLAQKEWARVERQIQQALAEDPKNFSAQLLRGGLLASQGKNEDAILALQEAISLDPEDLEAPQALAEVYLKLGLLPEAEKILTGVLEKAPSLAGAYFHLGQVLAAKGDAAAAASYQKAIALSPKDVSLRLALGQHYLAIKQYGQAEGQFQSAIALAPDQVPAHLLLGSAYCLQEKIGDAIREFQEAIRLEAKNAEAHFALGQLYLETGQFDKAAVELELAAFMVPDRAEYQNALGRAYFQLLRHDQAIEAFNRALSLDPANPEYQKNFDQAYADRQKYLVTEGNAPPLEIVDFQVGKVFSAIYKYYQDQPAGSLKLRNNLGEPIYKIKISFQVKEFMDTAWYYEIPQLAPHREIEVKIFPVFNNRVLELTEDSPVLAEIIARYQLQKQPREERYTRPFTLLKKSALTWSKQEMTGAFITTSDPPVKEFARGIFNLYSQDQFPLNEEMAHAMMIFDALTAYEMHYLVDPNNPYGASKAEEAVDYVQYPRETLRLKSGDCDDLSILFCALLENLGVPTAMVDVPGHVFVIFQTQVPAAKAGQITSHPDLLVLKDGKVWIPVEMTLVGEANFTAAWIKGAELYRQGEAKQKLNLIVTNASWQAFKPATLPPTDFHARLPSRKEMDAVMNQEKSLQEFKQKELIAAPFKDRLLKNSRDLEPRLQLGLAYADNGYFTEAKAEFEAVLKLDPKNVNALANLGSCALESGNYLEAVQRYDEAEKLAPQDAEIKINQAIAYYRAGKLESAQASFKAAKALDPALGEQFQPLEAMLFH